MQSRSRTGRAEFRVDPDNADILLFSKAEIPDIIVLIGEVCAAGIGPRARGWRMGSFFRVEFMRVMVYPTCAEEYPHGRGGIADGFDYSSSRPALQ
jgi:hypothetical protein